MNEPSSATSVKSTLRREALARRDAIDAEARAKASSAICAVAAELIEKRRPSVVAGYWPIRSEVDCRALLETLREHGIVIALPVVADDETILFRHWGHGDPLVSAGFGTLGPSHDSNELIPELVVMPLAGFDVGLHRLGYGKGHYDRAIARFHSRGMRPFLVGLAFAAQEVSPIPFEDHDMRLDAIVTEAGIRPASGAD
jgi:5-formyltetrahydrofolate cyclo-ligase